MKTKSNSIDYYTNFISYIKIIMEKSVSIDSYENIVVMEIYNDILNSKEDNEDFMHEMIITTSLFENKLYTFDKEKRIQFIKMFYESYLYSMIHCYYNNDIEAVKMLFNLMNERVKEQVGYYSLYKNKLVKTK